MELIIGERGDSPKLPMIILSLYLKVLHVVVRCEAFTDFMLGVVSLWDHIPLSSCAWCGCSDIRFAMRYNITSRTRICNGQQNPPDLTTSGGAVLYQDQSDQPKKKQPRICRRMPRSMILSD